MQNSHKDNVRRSAVRKQLKQKKSNSPAGHHLPPLDLFWASFFVRVQLTSLLLISLWLCEDSFNPFVEVLLYVHRNRRFIRDGSPGRPPRLSHSSWALNAVLLSKCCFTPTKTTRTIRDGGPRTFTSTCTQPLSSEQTIFQRSYFYQCQGSGKLWIHLENLHRGDKDASFY